MENISNSNQKRSYKEQRIRDITMMYYTRPDVKKAIFDFSKNRECIPRYFEGFGKRPDNFQYPGDIIDHIKKGATSFHSSIELWEDPLEISTELSKKDFNELRIGWDLLLDIDSPYLEYSKVYSELLINALKLHGINNIGVKFSGSKGMHIIIPWKAFPKEIYGEKTKDMFPEWPRLICEYLSDIIKNKLSEKILKDISLKDIAKRTGKTEDDLSFRKCVTCKRPVQTKFLIIWFCDYCKKEIVNIEGTFNNRKKSKCPDCRKDLIELKRKEIFTCDYCKTNSNKNPELFDNIERFATEKLIDADLVLVAPRHLFRMPYSLHEKTALASIVIDNDKIKDFQITDAKPLKVEIKNFYPQAKPDEAKNLLLQALDWAEEKQRNEKIIENKKSNIMIPENQKSNYDNKDYNRPKIKDPSETIFPPCIKAILNGFENDGKKRALFILINFFKTLGVEDNDIEKRIYKWNDKNQNPLKKGYIMSQLSWTKRNTSRMPPNCANPMYMDLGICNPLDLCKIIKNPVNYAFKKYFKKN